MATKNHPKRRTRVSRQLEAILLRDPAMTLEEGLAKLSEPTLLSLLAKMEAFLDDADRFDLLAHASFLEGTLVMPSGRKVRFEWDADDPAAPPFRVLVDALAAIDAKKKRAQEGK